MHKPVVATLPFSYRVFHKPTKPVPQVDAEKIVQLAQTADPRANPEVAQFRLAVQEKLASDNTITPSPRLEAYPPLSATLLPNAFLSRHSHQTRLCAGNSRACKKE